MSNTVSSGRFSPLCSRYASQDKKKGTLLTGNHAQYLDLCCFLSGLSFFIEVFTDFSSGGQPGMISGGNANSFRKELLIKVGITPLVKESENSINLLIAS